MANTSRPAPANTPFALEVFNGHIWILHGVANGVAEKLADLPGKHSQGRFGAKSYDIEVDLPHDSALLKASALIANRLRELGFGFFAAKEMSAVGHIEWLRNAGWVEGKFEEIYRTRNDVDRLRSF